MGSPYASVRNLIRSGCYGILGSGEGWPFAVGEKGWRLAATGLQQGELSSWALAIMSI
jgi:hypothetical protein